MSRDEKLAAAGLICSYRLPDLALALEVMAEVALGRVSGGSQGQTPDMELRRRSQICIPDLELVHDCFRRAD